MKFIKLICILFLIYVPLFSQEFEEFKLGEKQQFEGNKIFDEMVQSIGNVDQIKTIRTIGTASQPMEFGTVTFPVLVEVIFPGKLRIKFEDKEFIIDNDSGWLKYSKGYYENLPEKYINTISGNLNRNLIQIAQSKTDFEIKLLGERAILDRECYEIELSKGDNKITLFVDIKKKLPVQMIYLNDTKQITRTYLKYEVVDDVNYPIHAISTDIEDNLISEIEIEKVEFNIEIEKF